MTKLQTIEAQINTLPLEEQQELISKFVHLVTPNEDFELNEAELKEIDDRLKNDTETFTLDDVMISLKEKYATDSGAR